MTPVGRAKLLANGLDIGGKWVATDAANPFIMRGHNLDQPSTRLTVGPLPFSMSDDAVIRALEREGLKIRGKMSWEMARLKDRTMTGWKSGRRIIWIELPATPPRKLLEVGPLRVEIYYREMREQTAKCWNCKQFGHRSAQCPVDTVCFVCHEPGHKKGDAMCNQGVNVDQDSSDDESELGRVEGQSEADLQGHQGTDDEGRDGETSAERYVIIPQAACITNGARDPLPAVSSPKTAEKIPLPPDSEDDVATRTVLASRKGTSNVKPVSRTYAEVVSQGEFSSSSSSEEEDKVEKVPFKVAARKSKSKRAKAAAGRKVTSGGNAGKMRQSDITSFASMSKKRIGTETSPDFDHKGSQSQKQRL